MPITSKDIAGKLGLSQPTVSRILNGTRGYRVSAETRRKVLEAARQMGYRPNAVARSLRHRRTNIVGFYTGYGYLNARNPYLAAVLGGLQQACDQQRLDILLHGVFRGKSTDDIYGELVDGRIDGLFLHTTADDPLVAQLGISSLPVVAISDAMPDLLPCVVADDKAGVGLLVDHLWKKGHEKIAFLAPQRRFVSVERRVEGFVQAMKERGVSEPQVYRVDQLDAFVGIDALPKTDPPSAICCWNDYSAASLVLECERNGIRVPNDLAVTGFDGVLDSRITAHSLTTIAVPWSEVGQRALEVLRARINGEAIEMENFVPVRLVEGGTT